jgi:hypothetical protein
VDIGFTGTIVVEGKEVPFSFKNDCVVMQLTKEEFLGLFGSNLVSMSPEGADFEFLNFHEDDGELICEIDMDVYNQSVKEENAA